MRGMRFLYDAAHLRFYYEVEDEYGRVSVFRSLDSAREFAAEIGVKYFYAVEEGNPDNTVKIWSTYMYRYKESDIEDRLLANKSGAGFHQTF